MSRDKQIEEMARTLCGQKEHGCAECDSCDLCEFWVEASILCNAGYRKASDVAREIIRDIVDPVWRAYQNSENEMTSLLAAFICECIATKIKKKYESEGADNE